MRISTKIQVVGCPGSGKSTLAKELAARFDLRRVELDAVHWLPGWNECDPKTFQERVSRLTSGERWIVDGNYQSKLAGSLVASTVIWLDLPRAIVMRRVTSRTLRRALTREELWNGNREPLTNFYRWDIEQNIIRWAWVKHPEYRQGYESNLDGAWADRQVIRLRSPTQVTAFLRRCRV